MKYKIKDLAKLLVQSTMGVPKGELKPRLESYFKFLESIRAMALMPRILGVFNQEWDKANEIKKIEFVSARALPKTTVKELKEQFKESAEIEERVDESLLGGIEIKFDDLLVDATLKNRVQMLKNQILNS